MVERWAICALVSLEFADWISEDKDEDEDEDKDEIDGQDAVYLKDTSRWVTAYREPNIWSALEIWYTYINIL